MFAWLDDGLGSAGGGVANDCRRAVDRRGTRRWGVLWSGCGRGSRRVVVMGGWGGGGEGGGQVGEGGGGGVGGGRACEEGLVACEWFSRLYNLRMPAARKDPPTDN